MSMQAKMAGLVGFTTDAARRKVRRAAVAKYDEDQPRAPKGTPEGGQWTDGGAGLSAAQRDADALLQAAFEREDAFLHYFHGTTGEAVDSILEHGLLPGKGRGANEWSRQSGLTIHEFDVGDRAVSVFFSDDKVIASGYAQYAAEATGTDPVILRIRIPKDEAHFVLQDEHDPGGFRAKGGIPPEWISVEDRDVEYWKANDGRTFYAVLLVDGSGTPEEKVRKRRPYRSEFSR